MRRRSKRFLLNSPPFPPCCPFTMDRVGRLCFSRYLPKRCNRSLVCSLVGSLWRPGRADTSVCWVCRGWRWETRFCASRYVSLTTCVRLNLNVSFLLLLIPTKTLELLRRTSLKRGSWLWIHWRNLLCQDRHNLITLWSRLRTKSHLAFSTEISSQSRRKRSISLTIWRRWRMEFSNQIQGKVRWGGVGKSRSKFQESWWVSKLSC